MEPEIASVEIAGLLAVGKLLSVLLVTGAVLCTMVIILRLRGQECFKLAQVELPLRHFPIVALAFTVAHAYLTWILRNKVDGLLVLGANAPALAWAKLVNSDALIFIEMKPRILQSTAVFGHAYVANVADPAFWLTAAFAAALLIRAGTRRQGRGPAEAILREAPAQTWNAKGAWEERVIRREGATRILRRAPPGSAGVSPASSRQWRRRPGPSGRVVGGETEVPGRRRRAL